MPADTEKTQIGIRLPAQLLRLIDSKRHNKTRAEYCRELIEVGLATSDHDRGEASELLSQLMDAMQEQLSDIRQSAILAERDAETAVTEIKRLRTDFATAIVGVLTKIGQVVREEDQRKFSREKAERFVKRVLPSNTPDQAEEP